MKDKVSIVVPVYNTEKYLDECISSILSQDYKNIEVILVNDGSKDNSLKICQNYAEKDNRVIVIDKHNSGTAETRNTGLAASTGDWIMFMDSDDYYYTDDVISKVYVKAKENDSTVVCFNYRRFIEKNKKYSENIYHFDDSNIGMDKIISGNVYTSSVCIKFIRADILKKNGIVFPENEIAEDIGFCADLLRLKPDISFCEDAVYVYRDRTGSKTNTIGEAYIEDAYSIVKRLMSAHTEDENYMAFVAFQYCTLLINMNFSKISKDLQQKIYGMHHILKYNKIFKVKLIFFADKILGTRLASKLLFAYFKISK